MRPVSGNELDERGRAAVLEHAVARRGRAAGRMHGRPAGRGRGGIASTRRPARRCPARDGP